MSDRFIPQRVPEPKSVYFLCSQQERGHAGYIRRLSAYEIQTDGNPGVAVHLFDKDDVECEYVRPPSEASGLNTSAVGPGLDSDFGASAGMLQTQLHWNQKADIKN